MVEHNIRTWAKANGSWDVTHHSDYRHSDGRLHDVAKDFKNFLTREFAEEYAFALFQKLLKEGNQVELESPDGWGQETESGRWSAFPGNRWLIRRETNGKFFFWSGPANPNDKSKIPKWILKELNA